MRDAGKTHIRNGPARAQRKTGQSFAGYGYLTWTDNEYVPGSYWAQGYGGQAIGWFNDSRRIVIFFATNYAGALDGYAVAKAWHEIRGTY